MHRGDRFTCSICKTVAPSGAAQLSKVLASECIPVAVRQEAQITGSVRISGQSTHSSHKLRVYRGLYFWSLCGGLGNVQLRKLAVPCLGKALKGYFGESCKVAIANDRLPIYKGLDTWPEDRYSASSEQQQVVHNIQERLAIMTHDILAHYEEAEEEDAEEADVTSSEHEVIGSGIESDGQSD